ncbi:MAG: TraR/DksA C4-type zinc finger protein [Alphaproteobacteria bacterium]
MDENAKDILLARLAELEAASQATAAERKPVTLDQAAVGRLSRMDAIQVQAMAAAGERRRVAEIGRVKAALRRVDEGEYGYCVTCGEEIAPGRLEFDPAVAACVDCAGR